MYCTSCLYLIKQNVYTQKPAKNAKIGHAVNTQHVKLLFPTTVERIFTVEAKAVVYASYIFFVGHKSTRKETEYLRGLLSRLLYISNLLRASITAMYANIILDYRKTMHKKERDLRRLLSLAQWTTVGIDQDDN